MKVVHAAAWYFPVSTGGTEVYIDSLAHELNKEGIQSVILAAQDSPLLKNYTYQDIPVLRYPVYQQPGGKDIHGGFEDFTKCLENEKADVYHQHSWTLGCGFSHLEAAKKLNMPTVLTLHLPNAICARGTMMLWGENGCDGRMDMKRCSSCWMQSRGVPFPFIPFVSSIPHQIADIFERVLPRRVNTLLSAKRFIDGKQKEMEQMFLLADKVVVVSRWLHHALLLNGIPQEKLVLSRHGYPQKLERVVKKTRSNVLQVGYVGRWSHQKGLDMVVRAIRQMPKDIPIKLTIHGIGDGVEEYQYRQEIVREISNDSRLTLGEPLPHSQVVSTMKSFDLLVVPSRVMETGPYVVLEALAAGTPVLGSNLGGIAEWIKDGINGLLLPFNEPSAWTKALIRFAKNPSELDQFHFEEPLRHMKDVAWQMKELYQSLVVHSDV